MRFALILALAVALTHTVRSQDVQFTCPEYGIAYLVHNDSIKQVDFYRGRIAALTNAGWSILDSFPTLPDPMRLLLHPTPVITQTADTTLIHFTGSGVVYTIRRNGQIERLDRTFFAGYNFGAQRFFDGTHLWSLGGSGLWNVHDLALFYDPELREWERKTMSPSLPNGFTGGLYSPLSSQKLVSLVYDGPPKTPSNPQFTAYEIDLDAGTYARLGVAASYSNAPKIHEFNSYGRWGATSIIISENKLYLANLVTNELQKCDPILDAYSNPFNGTHGILLSPKNVYLIQTASTITNIHVKIEQLTYDQFVTQLNPKTIGPVYESSAFSSIKKNWKALLLIFSSFAALTALILRYQRSRPSVERSFAQSLSPLARLALRHLLLQSTDSLVTPDELNQILGIEQKSWDNQRKIRSTVLQELEEKGMQFLGVPSFIERMASEEDRRIRRYRIKLELREDLLPILKYV